MALTGAALTTLARLKGELGISDTASDDALEGVIEDISELIASLCQRQLHHDAAHVEVVPGRGTLRLGVSRTPLVSIGSIELVEDGGTTSTIPSTQYAIDDAPAGLIRAESGAAWAFTGAWAGIRPRPVHGTAQRRWRVTYAGGYVTPAQVAGALVRTLPRDLERLCLDACAAQWRARGADPSVVGERLMSWSATYAKGASGAAIRGAAAVLTPEHPTILRHMRRVL